MIREAISKIIERRDLTYSEAEEVMDEIRHTPEWKEIYPRRKESIERVFADCKEHHTLRYTRLRGLQKNQHQSLMIFACYNLKRMSRWRWKSISKTAQNLIKSTILNYFKKKEKRYLFISTTLSTICNKKTSKRGFFV